MKLERIGKLSSGIYAITGRKPLVLIDSLVKHHPRLLNFYAKLCVALTFIASFFLMSLIVATVLHSIEINQLEGIYERTQPQPKIITAGLILPVDLANSESETAKAIAPYIYYVPFLAFLIAIILTIFPHEASHYLLMRKHGMTVARYGIGIPYLFMIPIPLPIAFVDADLNKEKDKTIVEVACAGPGINIILFMIGLGLNIFFKNNILYYTMIINLAVGSLNALPALFLDGGYAFKPLVGKDTIFASTVLWAILIILPMLLT